jgi:integral membrane protein (TIGR01906 family)
VFIGFFAVVVVAVAAAMLIAARRDAAGRRASWAAVRGGSIGLVVVLVVAGAIALVAFDALFETFHQLFFPGGSYTFDPATERLVQLFPFQFWQETAIAVGVVSAVLAAVVAGVATRRLARPADPAPVGATLQSSRP